MRFYEYESRQILAREGIPLSKHGFATTADEAKQIAADIGGPVVIKSQVLTGGRMKAGGVKFADTPEEAEAHAREILALEIGGHTPRGVLVDSKAAIKQEYYAGVIYDGIRKLPPFVFSDMGGIDIEEVAEKHPDHIGRGHFSTILPHMDFRAKDVVASLGITGSELNRLTPILSKLARLFVKYDMTLAEINPLAQLADGTFVAVDAQEPHQARAPEAGRGQGRRDDVDRLQHARGHRCPRRHQGVPRAGLRPRGEDRRVPDPRRLGGGGLQDPREVRRRVLRPQRVDARGRKARRREDPGLDHRERERALAMLI